MHFAQVSAWGAKFEVTGTESTPIPISAPTRKVSCPVTFYPINIPVWNAGLAEWSQVAGCGLHVGGFVTVNWRDGLR